MLRTLSFIIAMLVYLTSPVKAIAENECKEITVNAEEKELSQYLNKAAKKYCKIRLLLNQDQNYKLSGRINDKKVILLSREFKKTRPTIRASVELKNSSLSLSNLRVKRLNNSSIMIKGIGSHIHVKDSIIVAENKFIVSESSSVQFSNNQILVDEGRSISPIIELKNTRLFIAGLRAKTGSSSLMLISGTSRGRIYSTKIENTVNSYGIKIKDSVRLDSLNVSSDKFYGNLVELEGQSSVFMESGKVNAILCSKKSQKDCGNLVKISNKAKIYIDRVKPRWCLNALIEISKNFKGKIRLATKPRKCKIVGLTGGEGNISVIRK